MTKLQSLTKRLSQWPQLFLSFAKEATFCGWREKVRLGSRMRKARYEEGRGYASMSDVPVFMISRKPSHNFSAALQESRLSLSIGAVRKELCLAIPRLHCCYAALFGGTELGSLPLFMAILPCVHTRPTQLLESVCASLHSQGCKVRAKQPLTADHWAS